MPPPIPILLMIQHLSNGGTERHFHDLARSLDPVRFAPHVIHFGDGEMAERLRRHGRFPVNFMPLERATRPPVLAAAWRVRRYIAHHQIALVVTFHFVADFVGVLAGIGGGPPIIQSRRDMGFTRTSRQIAIGRRIDRRIARYIAVSDAVRHAIHEQEGVALEKIEVIHNGTDLAALTAQSWDLAAERAELGIGGGDIVIGCVANMNPVKGHLTLVEAFARLRRERPELPLRLLLAGDGPMRAEVLARAKALGLGESCVWVGQSQAVAREFQLADVIVLPSETEGFSNTIVEAMAFRRPVVACDVGGNPEAVRDGETGLLVPPRDPEAMAGAIGRLAADADLRARMGEAGARLAAERFTIGRMMRDMERLFERVARATE